MPRKVIEYTDSLRDDFARTHIHTKALPLDFRYTNTSLPWRGTALLVYRLAALPVALAFRKLWCHQKFRNKKVLAKPSGTSATGP